MLPTRTGAVKDITLHFFAAFGALFVLLLLVGLLLPDVDEQSPLAEYGEFPYDDDLNSALPSASAPEFNTNTPVLGDNLDDLDENTDVYDFVLDVLNNVSAEDLQVIHRLVEEYGVFDGAVSPVRAGYDLVYAFDRETNYDFTRADYVMGDITSNDALLPRDFLRRRRGICVDYALSYVVALLEVNVPYAYYLDIDLNGDSDHAAAAVQYADTYYVLDQTLPLLRIDQYCRADVDGNPINRIYVYLVEKRGSRYLYKYLEEIDCSGFSYDTNHDLVLSDDEIEGVVQAFKAFFEPKWIRYNSGLSDTAEDVLACQAENNWDIDACNDELVSNCGGTYWFSYLFDEYEYDPATIDLVVKYSLRSRIRYGGYSNFGVALRRVVDGNYEYYVVGLALGRC